MSHPDSGNRKDGLKIQPLTPNVTSVKMGIYWLRRKVPVTCLPYWVWGHLHLLLTGAGMLYWNKFQVYGLLEKS